MEKVYILITECMDPYYGDNGTVYENEEKAREVLKYEYKMKRFAELYESKLIDNTGYNKFCF